MILRENTAKNYKEVNLDRSGRGEDRSYKNPLARVFQYEYALYLTVSGLFASVRCRSMCVESLKLYFLELGHRKDNTENDGDQAARDYAGRKGRSTQEDLLSEIGVLVRRDVIGNITFPMMHICAAEGKTILEDDGTHSFIFTDGIYGFKLHLDIPAKGHPGKIEVEDLRRKEQIKPVRNIVESDRATLEDVA